MSQYERICTYAFSCHIIWLSFFVPENEKKKHYIQQEKKEKETIITHLNVTKSILKNDNICHKIFKYFSENIWNMTVIDLFW